MHPNNPLKKFELYAKMKKEIENKIIEILKENPGFETHQVKEKLGFTLDTTNKYLKTMAKEGKIERKAFGNPWSYHYYVKTENIE